MKSRSKKKFNKNIMGLVVIGLVGILGGIWIGMMIQQMIFTAGLVEVAGAFNGEINVNFNETRFAEEVKEQITPLLNYTFSTIGEMYNFQGCEPVPCECWEWGCALYCMECSGNETEANKNG